MTTATGTREPEMGLTFEKVWAMFQETDRRMRESSEETDRKLQETDRRMRESREETDRRMQKLSEETAQQMRETDRKLQETDRLIEKLTKETNKQIGSLGGRFGELAEHLVAPGIVEKFNTLGYGFTKCGPSVSFEDKSLNLAMEIDLFLENGDCAVAVEVKANLKADDITDHMNRMEKLRRYADARKDPRKFYGAVAGAVISKGVREFALKNGFYVIAQSGDTMTIDVPEGFTPKAW
jgi:hypothetical protein